jgi:hypothetical protein
MKTIFYDDPAIKEYTPNSIFLAGPTARSPMIRTPWRDGAIQTLGSLSGRLGSKELTVILPEFRDRPFDKSYFRNAYQLGSSVTGMSPETENILEWETSCIDNCDVLIVWMPFSKELPGRTTRSEVARAICNRQRMVLGIADGAESTGHIRYHAHKAGHVIYDRLDVVCHVAWKLCST